MGGAKQFLTVDAPVLIESGFGVQLPSGWDGSRRVGLTLSARSTPADRVLTRGGLGREELADFRWSVAVGDEELSEEELTELVAAKAELVRVRGRWVTVDAERLRAGLEFLQRGRTKRTPTVAEVLALAQRHPEDDAAWAERVPERQTVTTGRSRSISAIRLASADSGISRAPAMWPSASSNSFASRTSTICTRRPQSARASGRISQMPLKA